MKRTIKTSKDGSHTILNEEINECYHSDFGAFTESMHIFINNGYKFSEANPVNILEIGFGTGLNAFLSFVESSQMQRTTNYHGIELYPVDLVMVQQLNFAENYSSSEKEIFIKMHSAAPDLELKCSEFFNFRKEHIDFNKIELKQFYDVVYFDAFSPEKQPEMWALDNFIKLYRNMNPAGVLLTYCCKGIVKRALKSAGFTIELLPGPPGKRHIIRATK
jgi:tRNA U34 5-methylaminomethyl-2-thiouridine-forming methyltransferase MnmC